MQRLKFMGRVLQTLMGLMLRHPVTSASILGFLPNGELVLVRRRDNGLWSLPGGMVDWGETLSQTIERELREETGLGLIQIQKVIGIYSQPDRDPRLHSICVAVVAQVVGQFQVRDQGEISDIRSFPLSALPPGPLAHDHARQIQDYLQGHPVFD